jgi:DNA-binding NarL/FixJ family response regulator
MINVIIVDDHGIFRIGLKTVLAKEYPDIRIVGEADCGADFFCLLATTAVDVVLLDIVLPDMSGVEIARKLKKEYPALKILAISSENTAEVVSALLEVGIDGFISKRLGGGAEIGEAVHSIVNGLDYFGKDIAGIIYRIFVAKKKTTEITSEFNDVERQIITLCRDGLKCKDIADRLCLSPRTVDNYKSKIFEKLGIHSTLEMVRYAVGNGIISLDS